MQKNKALKGLLAVTAVAAMLSTFGVQAQTSSTATASPTQNGTSSTNPNMAGKTTRDGTMDNTNSTGMENRGNQATAKSSAGHAMGGMNGGMHGSTGASGAGQTAAGGASSGASSGTKLSASDEKAVKDMAMADMAEVATAKMALSKAQSAEVKAYAQQMVDDHSQALTKVQAVAQAHNVTLPTDVDAKHKAEAAKLEKMSGEAFDKAYMANAGVKDHTAVHKKLMADAKKIKDADVKTLADAHMPVVEQHLKAAQQMPAPKAGTAAGK